PRKATTDYTDYTDVMDYEFIRVNPCHPWLPSCLPWRSWRFWRLICNNGTCPRVRAGGSARSRLRRGTQGEACLELNYPHAPALPCFSSPPFRAASHVGHHARAGRLHAYARA